MIIRRMYTALFVDRALVNILKYRVEDNEEAPKKRLQHIKEFDQTWRVFKINQTTLVMTKVLIENHSKVTKIHFLLLFDALVQNTRISG
ncbi:hypothetical protein SAMN05421848_0543 [Kushneria avicenniae]|uniref:Uncharacterized protein n=2 Tax=Kushneria avicenniae TaxID=402385 RepID=A0A1I1GEW3_9GAMM|nr:hypothetical protein SAMN05421848_0543 [Kushneria avicenniae]